ncbi:DUF5677 domain-containing protein [Paraburkholderia mimosarum]|uniref:DUF5677 domain-containing protein n=1 Tax=Paraburkholderia mimosarum TaxID=312026 RepID=UPI0004101D76|nr:DUF5677 domain-containing protein [Paraburkholderia mimosarum]
MPNFDEAGFLSDELGQWISAARERYAALFEYADRVNAMAMRMMREIPMRDAPEARAWAIAAFARALSAFQSCVLLAERGALSDARTLARLCAETTIVVKALATDAGTLDALREDDAKHELGVCNRMIELGANDARVDLAAYRTRKNEIEAQYPNRPNALKLTSLAAATGLELLYEIAYRYTSGNAAHATLGAFMRHIRVGENGEPDAFFFAPDASDMVATLHCAVVAVTELLRVAIDHMGLQVGAAEFRDLLLHWQVIRPQIEAALAAESAA